MYYTIQATNNKGADQTARMRRLICTFFVRILLKQTFSWRGSIKISFTWMFCFCHSYTIYYKISQTEQNLLNPTESLGLVFSI